LLHHLFDANEVLLRNNNDLELKWSFVLVNMKNNTCLTPKVHESTILT